MNGSESKTRRFIVAGGGTGGHIFPAIAIANAIKKIEPQSDFLFIGAKGKMEMEKVPQAGYNIKGLTIAGFNRSSLIKNITLPFKLIKSFFEVSQIFKSFKPDGVLGVGGYSSFPVLRYAQAQGIPTFIHESNSFAGKSNIMLGKKATRIFTAIGGMEKFFPDERILITGNPVRRAISEPLGGRAEALQRFKLHPAKKTILCIGGSLGAKNINEAIAKDLLLLKQNDLQLIWQTGKHFFATAIKEVNNESSVFVSEFISDMEVAYAAADVIISRSGAMAVSEICLTAKPVIFVPYPFAAEDHQTVNAEILVNKNAAILIPDAEAFLKLVPTVIKLSENEQQQKMMTQNLRSLAIKDADAVIAKAILEII